LLFARVECLPDALTFDTEFSPLHIEEKPDPNLVVDLSDLLDII